MRYLAQRGVVHSASHQIRHEVAQQSMYMALEQQQMVAAANANPLAPLNGYRMMSTMDGSHPH